MGNFIIKIKSEKKMALFTTVPMGSALLLFMGLIAFKSVIFKDKPSRGLK